MDSVVEDTEHCSICKGEGKTTPASNWCVDCRAGICEECLKLHNKVPILKTHDVSKITGSKHQKLKRPFICKEHEEKIKLFCKDCKKTLCTVCCSISHRKCEDVVTTRDMLSEVKCHLMKRQEKFANASERNNSTTDKYGDVVDKVLIKSAIIKTEITQTFQAAVDHLREKENELLEKLDVKTDQQTEKLRSKIKTKQTETHMYLHQSQVIQQALEMEDEAQLFEMYMSPESGAMADITETQGEDRAGVADTTFIHNLSKLKDEITKMDVTSVDYKIDLTATPVLHEVIDAKVDGIDSCDVRDSVVIKSSNVIVTVFADFKGDLLKSIYKRGRKQCSSILQVPGSPWCITVIGEGKVAVSLYNKANIITVTVAPDLKLLSTIQTSKKYCGLSYLDQSTLVAGSESPPSVDLIDMQGNIVKTFTSPAAIGLSWRNPRYIHVSRQGTILVSDCGLKSVICLTQSGDIVFTYTPTGDRAMIYPYGIASTSTGDILAADWDENKVIHINMHGEFIRNILTEKDGLKQPFGLCVDGDELCVTVQKIGLYKYKFK